MIQISSLEVTNRGESGFGSTGANVHEAQINQSGDGTASGFGPYAIRRTGQNAHRCLGARPAPACASITRGPDSFACPDKPADFLKGNSLAILRQISLGSN